MHITLIYFKKLNIAHNIHINNIAHYRDAFWKIECSIIERDINLPDKLVSGGWIHHSEICFNSESQCPLGKRVGGV